MCEFLNISTSFILQGPPVGLGRFQAPRLPVVKGLWRDWAIEAKRERGREKRGGEKEEEEREETKSRRVPFRSPKRMAAAREMEMRRGDLPLSSFPSSNQTKTWLAGEGKGRRKKF